MKSMSLRIRIGAARKRWRVPGADTLLIWNWTFYQSAPALGFHPGMAAGAAAAHFGRFYLVTSLAYDSFRAGGNAVMIATLGSPVLIALARVRSRLRTEVITVGDRPRAS